MAKHRKTLAVVAALKVDRHKLIGHLHELWWWAMDNARSDGCIGHVPHQTIAEAAGWPAKQASMFVGALIDAGFLDQAADGLMLHDWGQYSGKLAEQRESRRVSNREAQSRHRQRLQESTVTTDAQPVIADVESLSALTADDSQRLRQRDKADSKQPTVQNSTEQDRTREAGSPRLARPSRATSARGGGFRPIGQLIDGKLLAEHERRVAAERASQAMPGQPSENSLNGSGDDDAHD